MGLRRRMPRSSVILVLVLFPDEGWRQSWLPGSTPGQTDRRARRHHSKSTSFAADLADYHLTGESSSPFSSSQVAPKGHEGLIAILIRKTRRVSVRARLQDGPKCGTEDSSLLETGAGTGIARSLRVREGKEWTRRAGQRSSGTDLSDEAREREAGAGAGVDLSAVERV